MFGLGKEARERREALKLIRAALDWDATAKADIRKHVGLPPERSNTTPHPTLAAELLARVSKWETRRFGGRVLPKPSAVGYALEALSYGLNVPSRRPADQELLTGALTRFLAYCAKHPDKLNDADYELFQYLGRRFMARIKADDGTAQAA